MRGKRWMGAAALGLAIAVLGGPAHLAAQEAVIGIKGGSTATI